MMRRNDDNGSAALGMTEGVEAEPLEATRKLGIIGRPGSGSALRDSEISQLQRVVAEQAALRRLALLVVRPAEAEELFAAVSEELSGLLAVDMVRVVRFHPDGTGTVMAALGRADDRIPPGTDFSLPTGGVLELVLRGRGPSRVDDYAGVGGPTGAILRAEGVRCAAGGPIVVDGRLWGAMVVGAPTPGALPLGSERRIAQFAELVSVAISSIESRAEVERLVAEQSALRRVAELVARQASSDAVLALVTEELSSLLGVDVVRTLRFEPDNHACVVAARGRADDTMPPGTTLPVAPGGMLDQLMRTSLPARCEDYSRIGGETSAILRAEGTRCAAGGPIVVNGRLWGAMVATASSAEELPPGSEDRIARFAELVSTAISNVESRDKVERLAAEQAAMRRVAELVARQAPPEQVFGLVTEELIRLLDVTNVGTARFEPDGTATVMAVRGTAQHEFPPGTTVVLEGGTMIERVFRTGRASHIKNYDTVGGRLGSVMRDLGSGWAAAGPIVIDGLLWGAMVVSCPSDRPYPPGAEERVAQFAELVSMAISNIESRRKVERLAAEQSALRRVATLVAHEHSPEELFAMLAQELGVLFEVDAAAILRYEVDATVTVVAGWSDVIALPLGERVPLSGALLAHEVLRRGTPQRKQGYSDAEGPIAASLNKLGIHSAVASPIIVEGAPWGVIAVLSRKSEPFPPDTEARLIEFSRHAGMAVANAKSRTDLAESRARIVRTGDEARRRFERDLHDGAQQRLVSMGYELGEAEATVPREFDYVHHVLGRLDTALTEVLDDLREFSRGLHPVVLSEGGLVPALRAVARRSAVPIELRLDIDDARLDEPIEVTAYYVASEALTNTAKHAHASRVEVHAREYDGWLELTVSDNGRGGADPSLGTGLAGLVDRVEAVGGIIHVDSPPGTGTTIQVTLPIRATI